MNPLVWWKLKVRRGALRIALRRPMPDRLTLGDKKNNKYQVRLGGQNDDFRFIPKVVLPEGVEGWYFADNKERTDACLPNTQLTELPLDIIHHYREYRIDTRSPALFIVQRMIAYPFFAAWKQRISQFLFNRRRLARRDRMAILRYIFERTVEKPDFRTSSIDLPTQLYGMRFYGRDDHDAHLSYYELVLDSLFSSGDLKKINHSYALSPKAVATLDADEKQQERHQDNIGIQRTIAAITVVLALLAATQIGTMVWQELHPDPLNPVLVAPSERMEDISPRGR